jgi:pyruvate dehydrogenase E2 component (dihydrolipoamide acetyltransferase)
MPKLGADMTAGTLVAWTRQPGEFVRRGDIVAQVDTDKGVIDIEVFATGVLEQILVLPGQTVPVGTPLATIRETVAPEERVPGAWAGPPPAEAGVAPQAPQAPPPPLPPPASALGAGAVARAAHQPAASMAQPEPPGGMPVSAQGPPAAPARLRISPSARELARALGVDPAAVQGTGRGGAITREDIQRAAAQRAGALGRPRAEEAAAAGQPSAAVPATQQPAPGPSQAGPAQVAPPQLPPPQVAPPQAGAPPTAAESPLAAAPMARGVQLPAEERAARMRQSIAAAMSRSKREIPHYYLGTTIDLHRAITWLAAENERRTVTQRLLYGALLIKATALALRDFPELNGFYIDGRYRPSEAIHVGVAVSLRRGGLIAPALHHTDRLDLSTLMERLRGLVQRVRGGSLRGSELADPTITVTSLGEQGVELVFPVIYPPQVAIVGFGKVVDRAWAGEGQVVVRPTITATLAADHRVSDGHRGALFLAAIDRLLQQPESL